MSVVTEEGAVEITEQQRRRRHRRWTHTPQITLSSGGTTTDGSVYFSDSGEEQTTFRPNGSSQCGVSEGEVDLESGELERKVHSYYRKKKRRRKKKRDGEERDEGEEERECRICHLNLMENGGEMEERENGNNGGGYIQLGCDCKGDLGAAHKRCAETWFKIRGNM